MSDERTLFDFGDGDVPAHKHPNGGGWVAYTARVDHTAYVGPNAQVFEWARVLDRACISGYARVFDRAIVSGHAWVCDQAQVHGSATVGGRVILRDFTQVYGTAIVDGHQSISGVTWVWDGGKKSGPAVKVPDPAPGPTIPVLPTDSEARKELPIFSGVLNYFPLAIAAVSRVSKRGNDKHNPGQPLHWARGKSMDHCDCIARHIIDVETIDLVTGEYEDAMALAWRALAKLQELEEVRLAKPISRGSRLAGVAEGEPKWPSTPER